MAAWQRVNLKFQAKVLLPVVAVMLLFLAGTMWLVNRRIQEQLNSENQLALRNTATLFATNFDRRAENLVRQFSSIPTGSGFFSLAQKFNSDDRNDRETAGPTLQQFFLESQPFKDTSAVLFLDVAGQLLVGTNHPSLYAAGAPVVRSVLDTREPSNGVVQANNSLFDVVAVPSVHPNRNLLGVLVVAVELGDSAARQLKSPNGQIAFIANHQVVASTFGDKALNPELLQVFQRLSEGGSNAGAAQDFSLIMENNHYAAQAGRFPRYAGPVDAGYLLLSSYEQSWEAFHQTRRVLTLFSMVGLILGAVIVWLLVRRVTKPLRQLRDSAEAVGRGDFSRHIDIPSKDELGELAAVFNQMTDNLQKSRTQLEKTVEILRATQAQLSHSEKLSAVGEFVAGVAHELNNPLTALIGYAELLQMSEVNEDDRSSLQRISSSAERCHKIVHSLLSFARQHPPERKLAGVNALVEGVIEILIYELRTNNIRLDKELSPQLPRLLLDPHQIQQVFLNIFHNARQAIEAYRPRGVIRITTSVAGSRVRITFQDDGPGISEENLAKIFNPFFTTKPVGKGTGLGLSLSYGIIQEHGGTITAASKLGVGTTFIIELPITDQAESAADAAIAPPPPAADGKGRKVLVVDDEVDILDLAGKILSRQGYGVQTALDGESALRHLAAGPFDLIVSDWKMPGLSGQQLYERLLESDPEAAQRMVFMTGDVLSEKTEKFLSEHGKTCLHKPFSIAEFQKVVSDMMERPKADFKE
jgi:two-component system NtrC family sensor kinase